MIWLPSGGSRSPSSAETLKRGEHFIRMEGRETYRYATRTLATSAVAAIEKAGWVPAEVDLFVPHQANARIIEAVAKGLGLPMGHPLFPVHFPGILSFHPANANFNKVNGWD
jgi:3-oxoacyl-[acyl-carrier-protein] synthase-3